LTSLNNAIDGALAAVSGTGAGGKLRLTAASARSVSMTETFDPPLVFGYLGFDVPILQGGDLGAPIPTHANLTNEVSLVKSPEVSQALDLGRSVVTRRVYLTLQQIKGNAEARERVQKLDALAAVVPASETFYQKQPGNLLIEVPWQPDAETTGYLRLHDWRGRMKHSHTVLDGLLAGDRLSMRGQDGNPVPIVKGTEAWTRLQQARDQFAQRLRDPALVAPLQEASRAAWRTFYRLTAEDQER
jgi:hypothetical protein